MIDKIDAIHWELFQACRELEAGSEEKDLIKEALGLIADALDIMLDKASKVVGE